MRPLLQVRNVIVFNQINSEKNGTLKFPRFWCTKRICKFEKKLSTLQGFVDLFTSTFKAISPGNKSVTKEFSHFLANPLTCGHYRLHGRQVSRREAKVVRANGMNGIINTTSRDRCAIYSLTDFLCDCSADSALLRPQWKPEAPAGRPREVSVFDHWLIDRSTCNEMKEDECHRLINNIVAVKSSQLNVLPTDQLPADQNLPPEFIETVSGW